MVCRNFSVVFFLILSLLTSSVWADSQTDKFRYPFYIGVSGGYGSTTWGELVPPDDKENYAIELATPINVKEGGPVWGLFAGYELIPEFAIEGNYQRYQAAQIYFSEDSLFNFDNDLTEFTSNTESFSLSAKFMIFIPRTTVRVYSSIGAAAVHRDDMLANLWHASPAFGVGVNYNVTPHWMVELGANYTGGYGESELTPVDDYVPFLYSIFLRLAYRF